MSYSFILAEPCKQEGLRPSELLVLLILLDRAFLLKGLEDDGLDGSILSDFRMCTITMPRGGRIDCVLPVMEMFY